MDRPGYRYALSALREKRAGLDGEIKALQRRIKQATAEMAHVDASLRLLAPSSDPATLRPKKFYKRLKLFRQGELGRLITGVLRHARRPMGTHEIITAVLDGGGWGEDARRPLGVRVRTNLSYLDATGRIEKTGRGRRAHWALIPSESR